MVDQIEEKETTEVGSYFVSNYPPFSFWKPEYVDQALDIIQNPASDKSPAGLYIHIPFCRKRCNFCYFRVYTDKNKKQRQEYLDTLFNEFSMYSQAPVLQNRSLEFIYVGGGTPSALDENQILQLKDALKKNFDWSKVREVTFECEPGTLTEKKVHAIRDLGVTRLSLGVENFNDKILQDNGRAHLSPEVYHAYQWIQDAGFDQVNIDLIAGMVGETDENWRDCVQKTIDLRPDSVTIYQMELPFNTVYARKMLEEKLGSPVAGWETKRLWLNYAKDELRKAGYITSSAYTMVLPSDKSSFVYRNALWRGADMFGTGVSSFSYVQGMHYQNIDRFDPYLETVNSKKFPIQRALPTNPKQRLIREMILQLKLGQIDSKWFSEKFSVDILAEFSKAYQSLEQQNMLHIEDSLVILSPEGLLRVDSLLPNFYEPQHQNARYT